MNKEQVVATLEHLADLSDLAGENPFKTRAYRAAARTLEADPRGLYELVSTGELARLKGFGEALTEKVRQLHRGETPSILHELAQQVPQGVVDMLAVPGVGPKKARALWQGLSLTSIGALATACERGEVAGLKGFGAKSQESILAGLRHLAAQAGQFSADRARAQAEVLAEALRRVPGVSAVNLAGGLRRWKETVHDVDLTACCETPEAATRAFAEHPSVEEVLESGPAKTRVRLAGGLEAELRLARPAEYPFLLMHLTGSKEHNVAMRLLAQKQGYSLSEHGLTRGDLALVAADEAAIYRHLGLTWIPPELREDKGEFDAAALDAKGRHKLPALVEPGDIRGVVHCHTTWSDGRASVEAMARAAHARGYGYFVVCDHSQSAFYAGGLRPERVAAQQREVREVDARLREELGGFRVYSGIESDIKTDGSLDYEDEVLASFDVVVGSLHSGFQLSRAEQTRRVLTALANPYLDILAHPTGRLLLQREGVDLDLAAVIASAAEAGVTIEVNANPRRLELDWRWIPQALAAGARLSVDPDAHTPEAIAHIRYGVGVARKGWAGREHVVNCLEAEEFLAALAEGRKRRRSVR